MKPTLVTGATGFVGWHVARALLNRGVPLRVLARDARRVHELEGVDVFVGDLRNRDSLLPAVAGCATVYHVAADYRLWARDSREMYASNVDGTRNLLEVSRHAGVERFVYTSTVGCIGMPRGQLGDEDMPVSLDEMTGAYKRSKFRAEQVAREYAASGFPVLIVNPTAPVGERDAKPTPTGKIIIDFLRGAMPAYVATGLNLVDVRDVAEGHVRACERGRAGERYVLGCRNMTLREIFEALESISGVPAPRMRIPYPVAYAAGAASSAWARLTGVQPRVPLDGVRMARKKMFVRHDKAQRELGFAPSPVEGALKRAVDWFRVEGYC